MKTKRAYKERFYPTPEQALLLAQSFGCVRFVYNNTLQFRTDAYYNDEKSISHSMAENPKLAKHIVDANWREFVRQLKYKWADRTVVEIDRSFPSFKRCHACGFVNESLPLSIRE